MQTQLTVKGRAFWVLGALVLVISILGNVLLLRQAAEQAVQMNVAWSNTTSEFASQASRTVRPEYALQNMTQDGVLVDTLLQLKLLRQQVRNVALLPYAQHIFTFEMQQKLGLLIHYEEQVIALVQQDLSSTGRASDENMRRFRVANEVLEAIAATLSHGENAIHPFQRTFQKQAWARVWADAMVTIDQIDLMPLPDKGK